MQTAQEIQSVLKNLNYYSQQIDHLARQQFELDCQKGLEIGINTGPGSIRFECLAAIISACSQIGVYYDNININLETAIKQDKALHAEEVEEDEQNP